MRNTVVALLTAYLLGAVVPCAILFARDHSEMSENRSGDVRASDEAGRNASTRVAER
jgi:hypothetical protein